MTTAPTPSEAERLAMVIRAACALSHPRFGTDARFVEMMASQAQEIEKELFRLQADNERLRGQAAYQALQTENERLRMELVAEARAAADHKLRADQLAKQHRMQAQMHEQATRQLAELEASKNARIHELEMEVLDLASENSILKRQEAEELEARKPLPCVVKFGPSQRGEKCSLGTTGCVVIHDDDERKPLPPIAAIKLGMEAQQACRPHSTGTTNWAAAMTRFYERRLCGITGGSS